MVSLFKKIPYGKSSSKVEEVVQLAKSGKVTSTLSDLVQKTKERTVSPEKLLELLEQKQYGYYSRTFTDKEGNLTKVLSNGNKVVISPTVIDENGKRVTTRKVYNRFGDLIVDDKKSLSNQKQVMITSIDENGEKTTKCKIFNNDEYMLLNDESILEKKVDKVVRTKEIDRTVSRLFVNDAGQRFWSDTSYKFDYKADRVYKDNQLIGMRETEKSPIKMYKGVPESDRNRTYVTKTVPSSRFNVSDYNQQKDLDIPVAHGYTKEFTGTGKDKRVVDKRSLNTSNADHRDYSVGAYKPVFNMGVQSMRQPGGYRAVTGERLDTTWSHINYNAKGLPRPTYVDGSRLTSDYKPEDFDKMSLKEMRELAEKYQSRRCANNEPDSVIYTPYINLGLGHLEIPYSEAMKKQA